MTPVNKDIKYIDSFTYTFLQGQGFTRNEQAGCVEYSRNDLGAVTLRPLGEHQTDIVFSYPFRPQRATDLEIQRRLGLQKAAKVETEIVFNGGEYPEEVKQMFEEVFQERLTVKQNLQNNYWARLRQELSSPPVTVVPEPPYKEVNLPTTKENVFDYLKDHFTISRLFNFLREGSYINGNYAVYEGEESQKTTDYYLRLQDLTPKPDGALVMGEFFRRRWTPSALKDQPNIVFASDDDELIKKQWVFSFRFIQLEEDRIKVKGYFHLPVIFENNELLLTDAPRIWDAIWKKLFEDYGLNEDGTPASKNENGILAGKREKGNGVDVETRYEIFRKIKEAHPEFTYLNVADYANENFNEDLGEYVNGDTVKNTYRLTGHEWKRGKRAR